jgi:putative colanic acid biosysnthesis UDP-glucose lipid carrier transferase
MAPQQNAAVERPEICIAAPRPFHTGTSRRAMNRAWVRQSVDQATAEAFRPVPKGIRGRAADSACKRVFDHVAAVVALMILSPLLVVIAVAVRLDSRGPALFGQARTGLGGVPFTIWKFRTMTVQERGLSVVQARPNDHRVTRLGCFLRRTSLDELPQLWNVVCGEMSLVGPRPHALAHDMHYGAMLHSYAERFRVRPGMTGLAQVNGARGPTETLDKMARRVRLDMAYIERWTWGMELRIVLKTIRVVARGDAF